MLNLDSDVDSEDDSVSAVEPHLVGQILVGVQVWDVAFVHQPENKHFNSLLQDFPGPSRPLHDIINDKECSCYLSRSLSVSGS